MYYIYSLSGALGKAGYVTPEASFSLMYCIINYIQHKQLFKLQFLINNKNSYQQSGYSVRLLGNLVAGLQHEYFTLPQQISVNRLLLINLIAYPMEKTLSYWQFPLGIKLLPFLFQALCKKKLKTKMSSNVREPEGIYIYVYVYKCIP